MRPLPQPCYNEALATGAEDHKRQMAAADRHWPKSSGLPIPHVHGMYAQTQICNCDNAHHGSAIQWSRNAALAVMITGSLCWHNLGCMHVD